MTRADMTKMTKTTKEKYTIIPHTHWDREWRWPIWQTRKLLGDFMHELLDILDRDPEYHYILLDGQVSPIEDYLEVFPEDRARLTGHIEGGRIGIGPWYTLPDLYPVDGECLLRNLNKGISLCEKYGGHQKIGYNSFGWGQTAQFPQIYADYGFDTIICAKKVSEARAPHAEFIWVAPDGTEVLTTKLGDLARSNFFFHAYIDIRYGLTFMSDEFSYAPEVSGQAFHHANMPFADDDYFITRPKEGHDWARLEGCFEKAFAANANTLLKESQLLLSGCDFTTPQADLTEILARANEAFADKEFVNEKLESYTKDLHEKLDLTSLVKVYGELRDGPACDCSGNALATRIYLKQLNKKAQSLMLRYAEPLCAAACAEGLAVYPKGFFERAWKYLLDSHSHDSINGVVQDKTADDIEYRLTQAIELAHVMTDQAAENIVKNIRYPQDENDVAALCLFNPSPFARADVVHVVFDTPKDAHIWRVSAADEDGSALAVQEAGRTEISCPVHTPEGRPWPFYADRHEIYAETGVIPPMGYKVIRFRRAESYIPKHHYWYPMRKTGGDEIVRGARTMENEFLKVEINDNGTFDLTGKADGTRYTGLNYFEDAGDVGNYWAYFPPYHNRIFNTLSSAPRISISENGSLQGTITIEHSFVLPAYGIEPMYGIGKSERVEEDAVLKITTHVTLKKGGKCACIRTVVENNIKHHRLRVGFPTGIQAETACASGHFTVDERPIIPVKDENGEYWNEMCTLPMQNFVDLSDGEKGIAFLSNDITEYEACDDDGRTLYLTLFRAMANMIVTGWECVNRFPGQEGSQLLRTMEFSYAVYPHEADWVSSEVYAAADTFINGISAYQVNGTGTGTLEPSAGFLGIGDPNLILSAFKKSDDGEGYILRVFNPTDARIKTDIVFGREIASAHSASMREVALENAEFEGQTLKVTAGKGKILTYRLLFRS